MKKLTFIDSPFYSNWSQTYFTNLSITEHAINNRWFMNTLSYLKEDGILYVPVLDKEFNKKGKEIKWGK